MLKKKTMVRITKKHLEMLRIRKKKEERKLLLRGFAFIKGFTI